MINKNIDKNGKIKVSVRPVQSRKLNGNFTCNACGNTITTTLACPCRGEY